MYFLFCCLLLPVLLFTASCFVVCVSSLYTQEHVYLRLSIFLYFTILTPPSLLCFLLLSPSFPPLFLSLSLSPSLPPSPLSLSLSPSLPPSLLSLSLSPSLPPSLLSLSLSPFIQDYSLDEMERLLVLLLGCVVQCDGKVPLIERMKAMDLTQQQALVSHIQQMTDTTEYVCSIDWNDLEEISKP